MPIDFRPATQRDIPLETDEIVSQPEFNINTDSQDRAASYVNIKNENFGNMFEQMIESQEFQPYIDAPIE